MRRGRSRQSIYLHVWVPPCTSNKWWSACTSLARRSAAGVGEMLTVEVEDAKTAAAKRSQARCGECAGCKVDEDCGNCLNCADKSKFGGPGEFRFALRPPPLPPPPAPTHTDAPRVSYHRHCVPFTLPPGVKKQACVNRRCTNLRLISPSGCDPVSRGPRHQEVEAQPGIGGRLRDGGWHRGARRSRWRGPYQRLRPHRAAHAPPRSPPRRARPPPPPPLPRELPTAWRTHTRPRARPSG